MGASTERRPIAFQVSTVLCYGVETVRPTNHSIVVCRASACVSHVTSSVLTSQAAAGQTELRGWSRSTSFKLWYRLSHNPRMIFEKKIRWNWLDETRTSQAPSQCSCNAPLLKLHCPTTVSI